MKIFLIFQGCKQEGGGILDFCSTDKNRVRFEAAFLVEQENKELNEAQQYQQISADEWRAGSDVIRVIEREVTG